MGDNKRPVSLKDHVYHSIIDMITNGEIKSEDIFTEKEMIEHFHVSKSPVREALIQLCTEEIIRSIPRCGYQIIQINSKTIHDLCELRCYLELSSLQKLTGMLTGEMVGQLKEFLRSGQIVGKEKWVNWERNIQFHLMLLGFVGNAQVTAAVRRALSSCTIAYAQAYEIEPGSVVFESGGSYHELIVEALENHEFYKAHEYLKTDILLTEQRLLNHRQG